MPLPILQAGVEAAPAAPKACRVFVSYSHRDMDDAKQFMKFFRLKLTELGSLGIGEEQVFFDRQKLLAGDEWDDSIQRALEQAEYFIFLVSVDSLNSAYCRHRELALAVARGLPILQIILSECPWEGQPLPGDTQNRKLSAFGALPKDESFALLPVSEWPGTKARAWNTVVQQLAERMIRDQAQAPIPTLVARATTQPSQARWTPLLPYFCDQVGAVNQFNGRVRNWNSRALLVLARGRHEDNVPRFWDRLRIKNLTDYLTVRNGQLLEPRPLVWPQDTGRRPDPKQLASDMLGAMSEALTGNSFQLKDVAALGAWLAGLQGVVPLVTTLPQEKKSVLAVGLRALLDLLEQCPAQTPLQQIVIAAVLENEDVENEKDLVKALKLTGYQQTHVIDLVPLQEIEEEDIRRWHRDQDIQATFRLSEEELLRKLFGDPPIRRFRLGTFDTRVKPILGL
jgi:hypothetical protein